MKILFKYIASIFLLYYFTFPVHSQCIQGSATTFQKVYGGVGNERAHSIQQTADGGYIVAGETTSFGAGNIDWFVMKTDAHGASQWVRTYGESGNDEGRSINIKQTSDLGYIVCGLTQSFGAGSFYDSYVIKIDNVGNIQWEKRIPGAGYDQFRGVVELSSGDYLLTGSAGTFVSGNIDAHIVKISSTGNLIWIKNIGTTVRDHSMSILELPSGNIIFGGNTSATDIRNVFLIKIDTAGNILWSQQYGYNGTEEDLHNTILLNDGNLLSVGITDNGFGNWDIFLMKSDTNGNVISSNIYGGAGNDIGVDVRETNTGELSIAAYSNSYSGNNEIILINTDANGNINWSKKYGGVNNDEIDWRGSPMIMNNSEITITGGTTSFGVGGEDIFIIKTNECGNSYCNEQGINVASMSPNIGQFNYNVNTVSGGTLLNTNTDVNSISFIESTLCIDTTGCNLQANFSASNTCVGDSTFFTNLSIDSIGNIVDWKWYFGDGDSLTGIQDPIHLYTNSGSFNVTLIVTNDSNCIDSISIPIIIYPTFNVNRTDSICQGDSIFLAGSFQTIAGNYFDTLQTINGCDSIINTNLVVNPVTTSIQNIVMCQGDSVFLAGSFQTIAGNYFDTLQTINGCDSIVNTFLVVNPTYTTTQNSTICLGDSLFFNGNFYFNQGFYTDTLQTIFGCDSLLQLDLTVNPTFQINQGLTICQGDSVFLSGSFQITSGIYIDSLQTSLGCDSLISTSLIVSTTYNDSISISICQGDSIFLEGAYQSIAGNYIDSLQTVDGCDSIVYTNLVVQTPQILIVTNDTFITPCESAQLNVSGGTSYTWSPTDYLSCINCFDPIATPPITTTYTVTDSTSNCTLPNSVTIYVNGSVSFLIPNVFTPNGDYNNDLFNVKSDCLYSLEKKIYNRWGELIFMSSQINEGWDGRTSAGDEVPEGTYFYIIKIGYHDDMNRTETYTGSVTLLR